MEAIPQGRDMEGACERLAHPSGGCPCCRPPSLGRRGWRSSRASGRSQPARQPSGREPASVGRPSGGEFLMHKCASMKDLRFRVVERAPLLRGAARLANAPKAQPQVQLPPAPPPAPPPRPPRPSLTNWHIMGKGAVGVPEDGAEGVRMHTSRARAHTHTHTRRTMTMSDLEKSCMCTMRTTPNRL